MTEFQIGDLVRLNRDIKRGSHVFLKNEVMEVIKISDDGQFYTVSISQETPNLNNSVRVHEADISEFYQDMTDY